MNFDDQLRRFFGTCDLDTLTPAALAGGIEHMRGDNGAPLGHGSMLLREFSRTPKISDRQVIEKMVHPTRFELVTPAFGGLE